MWWVFAALAAPGFVRHEACDVPAPVLASEAADGADACEARCAARGDCGAWTYVSGWGRCRLHGSGGKRATVHLVAAPAATVGGQVVVGALQRDHDHAGKDFESTARDLPSAEACAQACAATVGCAGLVYVEGYRSCWLKRTEGAVTPKTFTCGVRSDEPTDLP